MSNATFIFIFFGFKRAKRTVDVMCITSGCDVRKQFTCVPFIAKWNPKK